MTRPNAAGRTRPYAAPMGKVLLTDTNLDIATYVLEMLAVRGVLDEEDRRGRRRAPRPDAPPVTIAAVLSVRISSPGSAP
ncbi:hypothetical protein ACIQVL_23045 [Streptomyces sp. NPDC090499]|uniref:hypothetical protein n=1 Tax=unclassified Streptomyces TaxID=2593676 RepID=UPI00381B4E36